MKRRWPVIGLAGLGALVPLGVSAQVGLPQPFTQAEKRAMLAAHNTVRCNVDPAALVMPPLVWDARLEATAQAWVSSCVDMDPPSGLVDHNDGRSLGHPFYVGENITGTYPGPLSPAAAVSPWSGEAFSYDYATNGCSGVCGHYTQLVWANTRRIGCARHDCTGLTFHSTVVCDYGPGGNFGGEWPYAAGSAVTGACDLIFADGFELGDLVPWSSSQVDGGDLSISNAAGLTQTLRGLQAVVDDTAGLYVSDNTPVDLNRYRARFRFDPNTFDPGLAQNHLRTRIFLVFEDGPRRLAAIVLRRVGSAFSLMARARIDDNTQVNTPFFAITDAPHVIEIDWKRSSGPGANDGWLYLWIDGNASGSNPVAALVGLDNSISSVDFVRLGALSVKSGAAGTLYFDEFESRNLSYIGP